MKNAHLTQYFKEAAELAQSLDFKAIDAMVERLLRLRQEHGRLFLCGVGGSAANCIHAVNDFRKLTGIEAYSPAENIAELTARTNDEGWDTVFSRWLDVSRACKKDALLVLSVGGGSKERNISANIVAAVDQAKRNGMDVLGIVGRDGGYTKKHGDIVVVVPTINPGNITPHCESFQAVIWHAIASDPRLMVIANKWESTALAGKNKAAVS